MTLPRFHRAVSVSLLALSSLSLSQGQDARKTSFDTTIATANGKHIEQRSAWFLHGRVVRGKSSAELRHRAYQAKMRARAARLSHAQALRTEFHPQSSSGAWTPLGPVPLASDATGDGFQNYTRSRAGPPLSRSIPRTRAATRSTSAERRAGYGSR